MFFSKCAPNVVLSVEGTLACKRRAKLSMTHTFLLGDLRDLSCDCCLQFTYCLRIVLIHIVLEIPPQIKIWGFKSGERAAHSTSHLLISLSSNRSLSQARETFDVWGWPRLAGTTVDLDPFLCVVPMMPKTSSVLPRSAPCSPFEVAHFHPQTKMG